MFKALIVAMFAALTTPAFAETFESLVTKLPTTFMPDVADVLSLLDQDQRDNFTLMRRSASSQEASDRHPRALLFGIDARLIVGFNACPAQRGFNHLELIQWRDQTSSFEFRRIDFSSRWTAPQVSVANPRACLRCHDADPRPIWLSYPEWRMSGHETYGFNHDEIVDEAKAYREFRDQAEINSRYRTLGGQRERENWPYKPTPGVDAKYRPNLRFGKLLNELHARWIAARLMSKPWVALAYVIYQTEKFSPSMARYLTQAVPGVGFDQTLTNREQGNHLVQILMREAGLENVAFDLRPRHLGRPSQSSTGMFDGLYFTERLVLYELWGAWTGQRRHDPNSDKFLNEVHAGLPQLHRAFERARCQASLESIGSAGYGSRIIPQESFFGAIRSLQSPGR